jgi:hypothetical protein
MNRRIATNDILYELWEPEKITFELVDITSSTSTGLIYCNCIFVLLLFIVIVFIHHFFVLLLFTVLFRFNIRSGRCIR